MAKEVSEQMPSLNGSYLGATTAGMVGFEEAEEKEEEEKEAPAGMKLLEGTNASVVGK